MQRIRSWLPASLRWRLTGWVAVVMLLSVAAIFVVVYEDTGSELRSQIDRDLAGDTSEMADALAPVRAQSTAQIAAAAGRFVRAQPFSATSKLLFVLMPGGITASNHPELFGGGRPEGGETLAQQDKEAREGRRLRVPRIGYSTQPVPDVGAVRLREREVPLGHVNIVVAAGEPLAAVTRAQQGVARAFVLAGALTLALALLASYLAGSRVSAPLRRMAAIAARIDAGDLEPRMDVSAARRGEVRVLAEAFNRMLDRLAEAFASQREFVADASHELRTPLTVIRGQIEVLAAQDSPSDADVRRVERLVLEEATRISRLVDDLLLLARAEQTQFLRTEAIDLPSFVTDLWDGISLLARRRYQVGPVPDGILRADPDRLAQALRNLARNAIEHTRDEDGVVRLEVERVATDQIRFLVLDNGPGIPVPERERIFERFHRTDQARARSAGGTGLGLAIVRAIAEAHGGTVSASDPPEGRGARIELVLPGFVSQARSRTAATR